MKTKLVMITAILCVSGLAMAKPISSYDDFSRSLISLKKQRSQNIVKPNSQSIGEEPAKPIREGRVKYKVMKGVFQTEGENKWGYNWTKECEQEMSFEVYGEGISDFPSATLSCRSTFNGRTFRLESLVVGFDGNVNVNPDEPPTKVVAYGIISWPSFQNNDEPEDFAPMGSNYVGLENRATGRVFLNNEPNYLILCSNSNDIEKPQPHPHNKSKGQDDNLNCTTPFTEIFRVSAEIVD